MCELYTTATQWRRCGPARSCVSQRPRRGSFDVLEALTRGVIARGGDPDSTKIRQQELSVLANHRLASSRDARDRERKLAAEYRLARLERAQLREKARLEAPDTLDRNAATKALHQSTQDEEVGKKPEAHARQDLQEGSSDRSWLHHAVPQRSQDGSKGLSSTSLCDSSIRRDSVHDHVIDLRCTTLRPKQPLKTRLQKVRRRAFERMNQVMGAVDRRVDRRASARTRRSMMKKVDSVFKDQKPCDVEAIFDYYDRDCSGTLGHDELRQCLADLGLRGANDEELYAIKSIIREACSSDSMQLGFKAHEITALDFAEKVVPSVQKSLEGIRRRELTEAFRAADQDQSGLLSIDEVIREIRTMGIFPEESQICQAILDVAPDIAETSMSFDGVWIRDRDIIDLERFGQIIPALRERLHREERALFRRVAFQCALDDDDREEWREHLTELHKVFHRNDVCKDPQVAICVLVARGIVMVERQGQGMKAILEMAPVVAAEETENAEFDFAAFIRFASRFRAKDEKRLSSIFNKCDHNNSDELSILELQHALRDCDVHVRNQEEQTEVQLAIQEFDEDHSGEVSHEEFHKLVRFIVRRLAQLRRDAARRTCLALGFDGHFEEICEAFDVVDARGVGFEGKLSIHEAFVALRLYRQPYQGREEQISKEEYAQLIEDAGLIVPVARSKSFGKQKTPRKSSKSTLSKATLSEVDIGTFCMLIKAFQDDRRQKVIDFARSCPLHD